MPTPTAGPAQWWAFDQTSGAEVGQRLRAVAHLARNGHTLCGRDINPSLWGPADPGTPTCSVCHEIRAERYVPRDLMELAGLGRRQLETWTDEGYLRVDNPEHGPGLPRAFTASEMAVACAMGALVRAGLVPSAACRVARTGYLGPGLRIVADERALAIA